VSEWYVYVIEGRGGRLYTGTTVDLQRRLREHNGELPGGAKATQGFRPWSYARVYGPYSGRSDAQVTESQVKGLPKGSRLLLEGAPTICEHCLDTSCIGHCPVCNSKNIGGGGANGMFCVDGPHYWD